MGWLFHDTFTPAAPMVETEGRAQGKHLSMEVYTPTSISPVTRRSTSQKVTWTNITCRMMQAAAPAAKKAKARICPIRRMSRGHNQVPSMKPAKQAEPNSPST